ncbi:MAG: LCP family protein [Treponema sp.]|nr:LCP family protein [Treponema sp.]
MRINREQKGVIFLLLVLFVVLGMAVTIFAMLWSDPVDDLLQQDQVVKTLFVMEDGGKVLSTNLFMYYEKSRRGVIINIPGNTGAIYKTLGRVDRIDEIYSEKGIDLYKKEIESLCGTEIPFYIIITMDTLSRLADLLGGMNVLVAMPVDQVSDEGERWLLPSGSVYLDGDKIRMFMNYQLPEEGETDMTSRRLDVLVAFLECIGRNSSMIGDAKVFHHISSLMTCDLNERGLRKLFIKISGVDQERIVSQTITGTERMVDGQKLLFPWYDGQLVKDVVKQASGMLLSESGTMSNRVYVLNIKNGTNVQGLARNTAALLKTAGYDILTTSNADAPEEKTRIINHIGNYEAAKSLGDFIHCDYIVDEDVRTGDVLVQESETGSDVDFTVVLGRDFDGRYVH